MNLMLQLMQRLIDMKLMIQWAVTSSALILIVLAVRQLFRSRLSARLKYALWGVVLLRLLVPFQVELPAAAPVPVLASSLAQDVTPWLDDTMLYAVPTERRPSDRVRPGMPPEYSRTRHGEAGLEYYSGGVVYDGNYITRYAVMLTPLEVLIITWIAGTALTALVILLSNLRFACRLKKRRKRLEGADAPIPVYRLEGLPSPCLFGVLRPAVYVTPQAAENPDTLRHVLAHELTHYAHRDHIWSALRCLALALHWYNPLVWLAAVLSKRDGELACDEGAIARLGEAERIPYGRTLVDMVAARSLRPGDLLSCSTAMTGGNKSVKQRVAQIVKKPETVRTALFAAVALVALGLVFTFAGRAERGKDGNYHTFLNDVKNAQAIHLGQEMTSSYRGPAITGPELLSQAKEVLQENASDWLTPPQVLEDLNLMGMRTLTLTGQDGQEVRYQLAPFNNEEQDTLLASCFCVFTEGSPSHIRDSRVAVLLKEDAVYQLDALTRQQGRGGNTLMTPSSSPELEEFFAQLESASSIRFEYPPTYSGETCPGPITDPRLLALVREKLSAFTLPEEDNTPPDPKKLPESLRVVLSDGTKESTYTLLSWNEWTWAIPGDALGEYLSLEEGEELEYGPIFRSQVRSNMIPDIVSRARMQERVSQDPSIPVPMTRNELGRYSLADICRTLGYQLQGWSGKAEDAELVNGYATPERVQLWYFGDEDHRGHWVLELLQPALSAHSSGYTVVSDQPQVVLNAAQYRKDWSGGYEIMTPDLFAAFLRPEDVVSVTAGGFEPGQPVEPDIPALQEQLTQALYHQISGEYDYEKHGKYVLTIRVKAGGTKIFNGYEIAKDADRLILSAGSEKDVVCLSHSNFATTPAPACVFVRSSELYRTILSLHQGVPELVQLTRAQVDQVNEAFRPDAERPDGSAGFSELSCFFTSSYDDPAQIDLEEFLRYCPLAEEVDERTDQVEYRKVLQASFWAEDVSDLDGFQLFIPMYRYPRKEVSDLLRKYAGVTVEQLDWGDMLYLERYDAFYNFTSDYGPGFFHCEGGEIFGDRARLWSEPDEKGERCELTLRRSGGRWLIQSHHTTYNR